MDFLTLALIYTVFFASITYIMFCGGTSFHRGGIVFWIRTKVLKAVDTLEYTFERCLPVFITSSISSTISYVFYSRNPLMQIFYAILIIGGGSVYTFCVLPHLGPQNPFGITSYFLIAISVAFFIICCRVDPGIITLNNVAKIIDRYEYDGFYYTCRQCPTCKFNKPARSKHCSLCDTCISRFDHHCSWVNSCIGSNNYVYFIGFIGSTALLCIYMAFIILMLFIKITISAHLMDDHYVDKDGKEYPISIRHVCQYMLVNHTAIFALFMVALVFAIFLSFFTLFHFYLILTNQTTNEFCKRIRNSNMSTQRKRVQPVSSSLSQDRKKAKNRTGKQARQEERTSNTERTVTYRKTPYYKGVVKNFWEIFS